MTAEKESRPRRPPTRPPRPGCHTLRLGRCEVHKSHGRPDAKETARASACQMGQCMLPLIAQAGEPHICDWPAVRRKRESDQPGGALALLHENEGGLSCHDESSCCMPSLWLAVRETNRSTNGKTRWRRRTALLTCTRCTLPIACFLAAWLASTACHPRFGKWERRDTKTLLRCMLMRPSPCWAVRTLGVCFLLHFPFRPAASGPTLRA